MTQRPYSDLTIGAVLLCAGLMAGCSGFNRTSHRLVDSITPYQMEVVQGNFVSKEQVEALRPGMSREQVRSILGSPLVASVFHADRWDYVFSIKRKGVDFERKKLTVYFSGFVLERVEGDDMPSEAEFVALLSAKNAPPKVPRLEATPEQLERYAPKSEDAERADTSGNRTQSPNAAASARPLGSYPPLER